MLLVAIVTRVNAQSDIVFDDLRLSKKAGGYLYGVCTNDKYIYACRWGKNPNYSYLFQVYDLYGGNILDGGGFNIQGVTGILDLTTDGKYFYGGVNTNQIYQMDFESHTLVSTITCEGAIVRHIAYDPVRDAFWLGDWTTLALYDRSGNKLQDGPAVPNAGGSSYYKDENGIEHLLLFCAKEANDAKVYDYNITTNTLSENPFFDYASNPNYVEGSYAGGCHVGLLRGRLCFFGLVQSNTIGVYPIKNAAYESNVVFHDDFEFRTSSIFFNHNTSNWTNVSSKQSDWHWKYTNETSGLTPFNGNYYITNTANGNDIIASPILDLSECDAATLSLHFANNSSQLSVLYRVNESHSWSVLYTSEGSHDTWTEIQLSLPDISSTYQIGLSAQGNNGFVSVDDVTITKGHQHTYVPVITSATCTEGGYTTFTCSECGDTYVGDETSALGHDWGDWTETTPPSCEGEGTKTRTCNRDASHIETENLPALGHDWGDWAETTPPTCVEQGTKTRTCSRDASHVDIENIPALGHNYTSVVTEPTCTETGYTTYTCLRCGDSYVGGETPALGHNPSWVTEGDDEVYKCVVCGKVIQRIVHHPVETATSCESYTWRGKTFTTSGDYTDEVKNAQGEVTDVYKLSLTINHSTTSSQDIDVYVGDHYVQEGFDFTVVLGDAQKYYTTTNVAGCDSVVVLNLIIHEAETFRTDEVIKYGESFEWRGKTYTEEEVYTDTVYTELGGVKEIYILKLAVDTTKIDIVGRTVERDDAVWYTLDGRRLDARPTRRGLYLYKGRKVIR